LAAGGCPPKRAPAWLVAKGATTGQLAMKSDVDRDALQKVLGDLETRLEAYLVEWRRQLGIQKRPESRNERKDRFQTAAEREKKV
jgi:hypothetical protein